MDVVVEPDRAATNGPMLRACLTMVQTGHQFGPHRGRQDITETELAAYQARYGCSTPATG